MPIDICLGRDGSVCRDSRKRSPAGSRDGSERESDSSACKMCTDCVEDETDCGLGRTAKEDETSNNTNVIRMPEIAALILIRIRIL